MPIRETALSPSAAATVRPRRARPRHGPAQRGQFAFRVSTLLVPCPVMDSGVAVRLNIIVLTKAIRGTRRAVPESKLLSVAPAGELGR